MEKTILQLDKENKLKTKKRSEVLNYLRYKYFLRVEEEKIYIYSPISSGGWYHSVTIIDTQNYNISIENAYSCNLVLKHLETYDCFEINLRKNDFCESFFKFQKDVYEYAKSLSNKTKKLILAEQKVFSSYPRLYKYDENKLIINNETKNLTLKEYKDYIDAYNSEKIESWTKENREQLSIVDDIAIAFTHVKQSKGLITYSPRLFGKITKDTKYRKYSIDATSVFYGNGLFTAYDKKKKGNIDYSYIRRLDDEEIKHFKSLWFDFICFIMKNTNKEKIDY